MKNDKYTHYLHVRMTNEEGEELRKLANDNNMSISDYIRNLIKRDADNAKASVVVEGDIDEFEYDGCDPLDDDLS